MVTLKAILLLDPSSPEHLIHRPCRGPHAHDLAAKTNGPFRFMGIFDGNMMKI